MLTENSARPQGVPEPGVSGYEKRDASVGWIAGVLLFLIITGFAMHLILAGVLNGLKKRSAPTDWWRPVQPAATIRPSTDYPKLQVSPVEDLSKSRAREEVELNSYSWVNQTAGIVHVPIERAMELVLRKELPTRKGTNQAATGPSMWELQQQRTVQAEGRR
jgi:hypothetical protein